MILDKQTTFSENQAITGDAISDVIVFPDNGTPYGEGSAIDRNLGPGTYLPLLIQITEDFNNLTSLTITIESDSAVGLDASPVVHHTSVAIPLADLVAGATFNPRIMPDGVIGKYLGLRYNVTGTNPTAGKITAALATEVNS